MVTTPTYAQFKIVDDYGETQLLTELENNLKQFLDWSFLRLGAWTDIIIQTPSQTDGYGGTLETLRLVNDPLYIEGQVWQGVRKDWVYESGVDFVDSTSVTRNPINIQESGIRVAGTFQTTGYHINYPLGRVVFDTAVASGTAVTTRYSCRNVQVIVADNAPWWRELQLSSWRADDIHFTQSTSDGDWSIGSHSRIQLPAVVIEAVPRGRSHAYEMGNSAMWVQQDVVFHVFADDRTSRNKIVSILQLQSDKGIWLFDSDLVAASGTPNTGFPLDYRGERVNGNVYPDIVSNSNFRWKKCRFVNTEVSEVDAWHPRLYEGTVRTTCEIVLGSA